MARKTAKLNFDRYVKDIVEEHFDRRIPRFRGGKTVVEELRELRVAVTELERIVEKLSNRLGRTPRPRKGSGKGRPGRPAIHETCTLSGCGRPHYAKGLCSKHYQQERRAAERQTKKTKPASGKKATKKTTRKTKRTRKSSRR